MKKTNTNNLEYHHVFSLIVGASGVGKTSLVKTLPANETLILSAESGLLSIKDSGIDAWIIESSEDLKEAISMIDKGVDYKHIFIDSLTEIGEIVFNSLKIKYTKAQNYSLYDEYSSIITWIIKKLRDDYRYNFWLTALDKMQSKDFTEVTTIDLVQKSLSKKLPAYFDEVFYYQVKEIEEKKHRLLCTSNSEVDFCKDRSGKLKEYEHANLSAIYKKIIGVDHA